MVDSLPAARRPFDPTATRAALHRIGRAAEPPWLHIEVARRMAERLALIRLRPSWVLEWWGAIGASGPVLDQAYPQARRTVVEPDAQWAARSRAERARPWWSPRQWVAPGVEVLSESSEIPAGAQLVWANMMLHAVEAPPQLFARWERLLAVDGFVMFSCLGPGTLGSLRALYARLGWPAPAAPFIDMHDLGDMLVGAGFADPVMDQETLTVRWQTSQALLAELRRLGGNTAPERFTGLRTPRWRTRLEAEIERLRAPDGRIELTFEVAYGHAFKAAPRLRAGEPTRIPLDDMRAMVRGRRDPASGT